MNKETLNVTLLGIYLVTCSLILAHSLGKIDLDIIVQPCQVHEPELQIIST